MSTLGKEFTQQLGNQSLAAVDDDTKRGILVALADADALTERAIAAELAEGDADDDEIRALRTELHHVHLPALEDADLVSWNRDEATAAPTDHPLFDECFADLLHRDGDTWDDVRSCVTDRERRAVIDALESHTNPVARATLARDVAASEASADDVRDVEIQLHHVHLPKLDEAGLVDYDPDEGVVSHDLADAFAVGDLLAGA
ncbi:DUF7344 domain-containing protein [Halosimplex sp. J119]